LRDWALHLITQNGIKLEKTNRVELPLTEVPDWLKPVGQRFPLQDCVVTSANHEIGECVMVAWYSGMGSVFLFVGRTNFAYTNFSKEDFVTKKVAAGIYLSKRRH
jgi:hypothetical protein